MCPMRRKIGGTARFAPEAILSGSEDQAMTDKFTVSYYPDSFTRSEYVLATLDNHVDAMEAAVANAKMYYGERSPIIVRQGKKKIHEIPRGAGRR